MNNIFITGEIGIGKSTTIMKILDLLKNNNKIDLNIGGYNCSRNIRKEDDKIVKTFYLVSITNSSTYKIIENVIIDNESYVNIYSDSFDNFSFILDEDIQNCDLIILDEIGFAENNSPKYIQVLKKILYSDKVVLGVLKKHNSPLINNIKQRDDNIIFTIDKNNRDYLYKDIYNNLINLLNFDKINE